MSKKFPLYKLYAGIIYEYSEFSSHYTAFCHLGGKWRLISDSSVKAFNQLNNEFECAVISSLYMVFYEKIN